MFYINTIVILIFEVCIICNINPDINFKKYERKNVF